MKLSLALFTIWTATALGQAGQTCTAELVQSDDCASVINANACYNQNRWAKGNGTLGCIDGTDNNDKARKVILIFLIMSFDVYMLTICGRLANAVAVSVL
jgi:hypothetical protein